MKTLIQKDIFLRALEPTDLDFLYLLENDETLWEVSNTVTPYSRFVLKQYLENAHRDIYEIKQLRLVICSNASEEVLGFIDLFDFEPKHGRVGVGIVIFSEADKNKGYASQALKAIIDYVFQYLNLHQIYANISEDNTLSVQLFEKAGFIKSGVRRDWMQVRGNYKNELLYQLIHEEY